MEVEMKVHFLTPVAVTYLKATGGEPRARVTVFPLVGVFFHSSFRSF